MTGGPKVPVINKVKGKRKKRSLYGDHLGVTSRMTKVQQNRMSMMNANCFINRDSIASPFGERDSMLIAF
jgi:hypothetical protein